MSNSVRPVEVSNNSSKLLSSYQVHLKAAFTLINHFPCWEESQSKIKICSSHLQEAFESTEYIHFTVKTVRESTKVFFLKLAKGAESGMNCY